MHNPHDIPKFSIHTIAKCPTLRKHIKGKFLVLQITWNAWLYLLINIKIEWDFLLFETVDYDTKNFFLSWNRVKTTINYHWVHFNFSNFSICRVNENMLATCAINNFSPSIMFYHSLPLNHSYQISKWLPAMTLLLTLTTIRVDGVFFFVARIVNKLRSHYVESHVIFLFLCHFESKWSVWLM